MKPIWWATTSEMLGTFLFMSVILENGHPIAIAVALLAAIYFGGNTSGAAYNPAVSIVMCARGRLTPMATAAYVAAQLLGAALAYAWFLRGPNGRLFAEAH
jgi:glycerol uptake facilitator-like aquaporin